MARYIDADKYVEYLEKEICSKCIDEVCSACGLDSARWIAEEFPAEDVVPKSEVENAEAEIERLKHILNCYALQYGTVTEQQKVIDDAKSEVAREIFEEIEEIAIEHEMFGRIVLMIGQGTLAELKKKYTEEKE